MPVSVKRFRYPKNLIFLFRIACESLGAQFVRYFWNTLYMYMNRVQVASLPTVAVGRELSKTNH